MRWIGLTGGLGSGKSTVSNYLRELGYAVVDADEMARLAVRPGGEALQKVVDTFGKKVLTQGGELDRGRMADLVFGDRKSLSRLEAIVHPVVRQLTQARRKALEDEGTALAFYDVPLLFEKGMEKEFDATVVVSASIENQIARTMSRDRLTRDQVLQRLEAQIPLSEKARRGDFVVNNDGDLEKLKAQVDTVLQKLKSLPGPRRA